MPNRRSQPLPIIWTAKEIGRVIGRSPGQTFHLLQRGHIPGAFKVGRQYGLRLDVFKAETAARRTVEASDAAA